MKEREQGGALFSFPTATGSYLLPHSFYGTPAYWGAYVCGSSSAASAINDTYKMLDYQLSPAPGAAGKLQVERVNAHSGANIFRRGDVVFGEEGLIVNRRAAVSGLWGAGVAAPTAVTRP